MSFVKRESVMMAEHKWHAANNGAGKMRWFVCRGAPGKMEYFETEGGKLRRFASHEAAECAAHNLNHPDRPPVTVQLKRSISRIEGRLRRGEKIMRDACGRIQWADGRSVAGKTVSHMLSEGMIAELDTDLFGNRSRGQTIGLAS